jgi:diphthine methyl ester synthase
MQCKPRDRREVLTLVHFCIQIVQSADLVFLEAYTSVLEGAVVDAEKLQLAYQCKSITVADRDMVEQQAEDLILEPARDKCVAFLVVGDPVCATTHTDLWLRCRRMGIAVQTIHNASIMGAVGACGLQLYRFGQTVSIPLFEENWRPLSFYPKIQFNRKGQLHTLCLLDIKVKEPDFAAMMKGQQVYLPPRFMTVAQAAAQLIEAEETMQKGAYDPKTTLCVGLARMGQSSQFIVAGTLDELQRSDCGGPLHSLIITGGDLHDLELDFLKEFLDDGSTYVPEISTAAELVDGEGDEDERK